MEPGIQRLIAAALCERVPCRRMHGASRRADGRERGAQGAVALLAVRLATLAS